MRHTAHLEGVNVGSHGGGVNALLLHLLAQESGVVDTLRAGEDLLTAHEEIVRV